MTGSTVWVAADIARIASGGVALAPSLDFAAGVAWLAAQLNAPVLLPARGEAWPELTPLVVTIDGQEATRC